MDSKKNVMVGNITLKGIDIDRNHFLNCMISFVGEFQPPFQLKFHQMTWKNF